MKVSRDLSRPVTEKVSQDVADENVKCGVSSMQGWKISQQDASNCMLGLDQEGTNLFAVFDGHGGSCISNFCSLYLPSFILDYIDYTKGDIETALKTSFLEFDASLNKPIAEIVLNELAEQEKKDIGKMLKMEEKEQLAVGGGKKNRWHRLSALNTNRKSAAFECGSTAIVCVQRGARVVVANAGDSRCVLCRKNGKVLELSKDHNPSDLMERSRIEKAGGRVTGKNRVNGGINVSRTIGDHKYKSNQDLSAKDQALVALPDVRVVDLQSTDDFLVLASDGIWNCLSNSEVVDFVRKSLQKEEQLSTICENLMTQCLASSAKDKYGRDNMTCIIVKFLNLAG